MDVFDLFSKRLIGNSAVIVYVWLGIQVALHANDKRKNDQIWTNRGARLSRSAKNGFARFPVLEAVPAPFPNPRSPADGAEHAPDVDPGFCRI